MKPRESPLLRRKWKDPSDYGLLRLLQSQVEENMNMQVGPGSYGDLYTNSAFRGAMKKPEIIELHWQAPRGNI